MLEKGCLPEYNLPVAVPSLTRIDLVIENVGMKIISKPPYILVLSGVILLLAGCGAPVSTNTPAVTSTTTPSPSPVSTFTPSPTPSATATAAPPFLTEWQASAHADAEAPAFRFWDEAAPAIIPSDCSRCHSSAGLLDYLGAGGSQPGAGDAPAEVGSVIDCEACHNDFSQGLDSVIMPSGVELTGLGQEAVCIQCHQGLASGSTLMHAVKSSAPNGISPALEFISVHYSPAGAVFFGSKAGAGYEYPGRAYAGPFNHTPGFNTCTACHDAHSLRVQVELCAGCHPGIESIADLEKGLRLSTVDYDSDGNTTEGLALEVETFRSKLFATIEDYAAQIGYPIAYNPTQDPYFFDAAGKPYRSWTPVLLEAAYNFHLASMDSGAFSHNPWYIMQLLYDSLQNLGGRVTGLIRP
jgi:hypothetical protein